MMLKRMMCFLPSIMGSCFGVGLFLASKGNSHISLALKDKRRKANSAEWWVTTQTLAKSWLHRTRSIGKWTINNTLPLFHNVDFWYSQSRLKLRITSSTDKTVLDAQMAWRADVDFGSSSLLVFEMLEMEPGAVCTLDQHLILSCTPAQHTEITRALKDTASVQRHKEPIGFQLPLDFMV